MKKRYISAQGLTLSINDWAKRTGVSPNTIHQRLMDGWSEEAAATAPKKRPAQKVPPAPKRESITAKAKAAGVPAHMVYSRKKAGWPPDTWYDPDALSPAAEARIKTHAELVRSRNSV